MSTRRFWLTQLTQLARHPARAGVESKKQEARICHLQCDPGTALAALQLGDMGYLKKDKVSPD